LCYCVIKAHYYLREESDQECFYHHRHFITSATDALSDDGTMLAVADYTNKIFTYDFNSGGLAWSIPTGSNIKTMEFSPDNEKLAVGLINGSLLVLNSANGSSVWTGSHTSGMTYDLVFHDDMLLSADGNMVKYWPVSDGTLIWQALFGSFVHTVSVNTDGRTVAAGGQLGGLILLDGPSGQTETQIAAENTIFQTGFVPGENQVWFTCENTIKACYAGNTWKIKK